MPLESIIEPFLIRIGGTNGDDDDLSMLNSLRICTESLKKYEMVLSVRSSLAATLLGAFRPTSNLKISGFWGSL